MSKSFRCQVRHLLVLPCVAEALFCSSSAVVIVAFSRQLLCAKTHHISISDCILYLRVHSATEAQLHIYVYETEYKLSKTVCVCTCVAMQNLWYGKFRGFTFSFSGITVFVVLVILIVILLMRIRTNKSLPRYLESTRRVFGSHLNLHALDGATTNPTVSSVNISFYKLMLK